MSAEGEMSREDMERGLSLLEERGLITKLSGRYVPSLQFYSLTAISFQEQMKEEGAASRPLREVRNRTLVETILYTGDATKDEIHCMANCLLTVIR